jgi:hypothetical protein
VTSGSISVVVSTSGSYVVYSGVVVINTDVPLEVVDVGVVIVVVVTVVTLEPLPRTPKTLEVG